MSEIGATRVNREESAGFMRAAIADLRVFYFQKLDRSELSESQAWAIRDFLDEAERSVSNPPKKADGA